MNTSTRRRTLGTAVAAVAALALSACGGTPSGSGAGSPTTASSSSSGTSTPGVSVSPSAASSVEVTVTPAAAAAAGSEQDARAAGETAAQALVALNSIGDLCTGEPRTKTRTVRTDLPFLAEWLTPGAVERIDANVLSKWTQQGNQEAIKTMWLLVLVDAAGTNTCTGVTPATVTGPVTVDSPDGKHLQATVANRQETMSTRKSDGQKMRGPADRTVTLTMTRNTASTGHPWLVDDWTGTFQFGTAVPA